MGWAYHQFGDKVYNELAKLEKDIENWCEENDLDFNSKQKKALLSVDLWKKHKRLLQIAESLMNVIGNEEFKNFNIFSAKVEEYLKKEKIKLSASEKNLILGAVSWYDESAEKVIKSKTKIKDEKREQLLDFLDCEQEELPDYGYYPTDKPNEYIQYETESDLRDYENVPLKENIYEYFLQEVKPHVAEAWINLDNTKIGYEISFNKYFYKHKPLRSIEEVSADILQLEKESEGLIHEILSL